MRKNGKYTNCKICNKSFYISKKRFKTAKYCSRKCQFKGQGLKGSKNQNWKGGKKNKICLCCKKEYKTYDSQRKHCSKNCYVKNMVGNKLSEKTKLKMGLASKGKSKSLKHRINISEAKKGKNCNWWQGGKTKLRGKIYNSFEYKNWRKKIFERDNYTCQECKQLGSKYLEAHHIKPFAKYPKLRFDVNNGITLCKECHKLTDNYGSKCNFNK